MTSSIRSKSFDESITHQSDISGQRSIMLRRAIRFACTGVLVTGIHMVIAILFIQVIQNSPLANGVAFIGATFTSYVINTTWSFSSRLRGKILFRFMLVSLLGFLLAMFVALVAQMLGCHYLLGIGAVAITIPPTTFLLHNFWTYR